MSLNHPQRVQCLIRCWTYIKLCIITTMLQRDRRQDLGVKGVYELEYIKYFNKTEVNQAVRLMKMWRRESYINCLSTIHFLGLTCSVHIIGFKYMVFMIDIVFHIHIYIDWGAVSYILTIGAFIDCLVLISLNSKILQIFWFLVHTYLGTVL